MSWPPAVLAIRVVERGRHKLRLWLPLFVLWPVMPLLAALAPLLLFVASLVKWRGRVSSKVLFAAPQVIAVFWHLRGLEICVKDSEDQFYLSFR